MPSGSSPRMRGTLDQAAGQVDAERIIPAHAGNTPPCVVAGRRPADHPRACGEHNRYICEFCNARGSSPRMRGTHHRDRGKLPLSRIIPAHAGNTNARCWPPTTTPDHPRACGEHDASVTVTLPLAGSSPRMRGTRMNPMALADTDRIIPAHAGNTARILPMARSPSDHPRACGEHSGGHAAGSRDHGSSPRMRGTRGIGLAGTAPRRIIPAHAGNT